jgi:hypothetical protein
LPAISSEVGALRDAIDITLKLSAQLEDRLGNALRPSTPQAQSTGDPMPQSPNAPLADELGGLASRLHSANARLDDILRRCEL